MQNVRNAVWDPTLNAGDGGWRRMEVGDLGGGGGGPSGGLTDTQLRASPVPMVPRMLAGGNGAVEVTGAGTFQLPAQACYQVTVYNPSDTVVVEVSQDGNPIPVQPKSRETLFGITNANVLFVGTSDGTALSVPFRWEG